MFACAIRIDIRLPGVQSLKGKRAVLRPHVERLRRMASLSVSEVDDHDFWQRATLGVAVVAPDSAALESMIDRVRRYVDGQVDIELVDLSVSYLEEP
ncbi:MAG TPA: DUF503 domain-containing protein [Acidimicrobiia bacterium]|nr:DUF503 domain-containing protein [Acidimicrobiia bacterium]